MPSSIKAAQGKKSTSCVVERRYSERFIIDSNPQIAGDAKMAARDIYELGIAFRRPHRGGLTDEPEQETGEPEPQTETKCRRQGAIEDRNRTRCPTKEDRLGQRAMHRHGKAGKRINVVRHTSTPPPNEKNERKKELAANAIDRPNTI